jgi:hypothetical protein
MKRTLFLGEGQTFGLPFSDVNPPILFTREIVVEKGMLFKEAAGEALWERRGVHLFLQPEELPLGATLLDTLVWLDQEAPSDTLLLFPLKSLHPRELPREGAWVPVVEEGESPLLIYYLLLEMKEIIRGIAIKGGNFSEDKLKLLLDPITKNEGAFSLLSLKGTNYLDKLKKSLL